jgi:hypothetical protein
LADARHLPHGRSQAGTATSTSTETGTTSSRLVDLFKLATWEELVALLDENGPDGLLHQIRAAEAIDPEGRQWPRTKHSDDATAVYLVLDEATSVQP